jgi:hypothetical protein
MMQERRLGMEGDGGVSFRRRRIVTPRQDSNELSALWVQLSDRLRNLVQLEHPRPLADSMPSPLHAMVDANKGHIEGKK